MKLVLSNGSIKHIKLNMQIEDTHLINQIRGHAIAKVSLSAREMVDLDSKPFVRKALTEACLSVAVSEEQTAWRRSSNATRNLMTIHTLEST